MKLNLGAGESKLAGFVNVDFEESTKPDVVCNFKKDPLPYEPNSADAVHLIHVIEHIEMKYWDHVFAQISRVLKEGGVFLLAYPEFSVCAKYFIENERNLKSFWAATLYGRQDYPGDYHVSPVETSVIQRFLKVYGFDNVIATAEPFEDHNTFVSCKKAAESLITRADVLRTEIYVDHHKPT